MVTRSTQGWPPESTLDAGDADEADASGLYDTPGERWYECDRCGFLFPKSETRVEEITGLRVCTTGPEDYDEPDPKDPRLRGFAGARLFQGTEEVTD